MNEIYVVSLSSIPILGSLLLSLMTMLFLIASYGYIDNKPVLLYFVMIEGGWVSYALFFLLMVNAPTPWHVFFYARCLYTCLMFLVTAIIYAVDYIVGYKARWSRRLSLGISLGLSLIIWISDGLILKSSLMYTFYYTPRKGPLLWLLLIYALCAGLVLIYRMNYFKNHAPRDEYKVVRPMAIGVVFFVLHSAYVGYTSVINPILKPTIYISSMFMTLMITLYIYNDIKYNISLREKMLEAYIYDELTQVYTRDYCLNQIEEKLYNRDSHSYYIAIIDLDGFKYINDVYGHLKGDDVLRGFGHLCKKLKTESISVGRLGGDEFIVLFGQMNKRQVEKWLNKLSDAYLSYLSKCGVNVYTGKSGISVGYSQLAKGWTLKELLTFTDKTMYEAKISGKNNIVYYG